MWLIVRQLPIKAGWWDAPLALRDFSRSNKHDHAQIFYVLDLGVKILLIWPTFHDKTVSRPGDIKTFRPGRRLYMYTVPPFMDAVLSEERQSMKWVGIFRVGIFWVRIFCGGIFQGGVWWVGIFRVRIFPAGIFLEP